MLQRFNQSIARTITEIGKEFTSTEHIITYEGNVLQYWWQCYKILQLYRFLKMIYSENDEKYMDQMKVSLRLVRAHCDLIDAATNCTRTIKNYIQLCTIHERISNEVSSGNNNNFFSQRDVSGRVQMSGSRHHNIEKENAPWYETLLERYRTPTVDDSIGKKAETTSFRINNVNHHTKDMTDDEKRSYAYCIFLCYFYRTQLDSSLRNSKVCWECISKMERYCDDARRMEKEFERRCDTNECSLLIVRYFDLTTIQNDNNSMYYTTFIQNVIADFKLKYVLPPFDDTSILFFNVETMKEQDLQNDCALSSHFVNIPITFNKKD